MKRKGPPKGSTRTIRIDLQYDGGPYVGWQRQAKGLSVQGLLEKALSKVANERISLVGASRTDAGVHAHHQVASFSLTESTTPVHAFVRGTNTLLPSEIRVLRAREVDLSFHATADAKEKTYRYFFQIGNEPLVFLRNYSWTLPFALDLPRMKEASEIFVGAHDFTSFRATNSQTKTSTRKILSVEWKNGPLKTLCFEIRGEGFLKHMVRNMVGTLVEVGQGKRKAEEIRTILESKDRRKAGMAAPPQGLFLWKVLY